MNDSLPFLISGITFGLAAGISPGPLLAIVISETLQHSRKEGFLVALAPIVTDLPIVLISIVLLSKLSHSEPILGILSLAGAVFLAYLSYQSFSVQGFSLSVKGTPGDSLKKGVLANFLSPHPYLFWISVGSPVVLKAYSVNLLSALIFVTSFYALLVGSKIAVALLVDTSKSFLKSTAYLWTLRLLGGVLLIFALLFTRDGLRLLGFI
jgi:threonine/homoserine/homoserine lactone efflux protein